MLAPFESARNAALVAVSQPGPPDLKCKPLLEERNPAAGDTIIDVCPSHRDVPDLTIWESEREDGEIATRDLRRWIGPKLQNLCCDSCPVRNEPLIPDPSESEQKACDQDHDCAGPHVLPK